MTDKQQELRALLEETIDEQVDKRVSKIQNENKELRATVNKLQDKVLTLVDERDAARNEAKDAKVLLEVAEIFKARLDSIQEKPVRSEFVYNLLKLFFEPDFEESTYDCPTWLGAVVNFYSHKDVVIRLLKVLDIYVPNNIEKFRLPHEWTTEELDIVFDTMPKHIVCNSCTYADNLRFWETHALDDVYDVCYNCMSYSEIPWQFLLSNPNLLNKKYLKKSEKWHMKNLMLAAGDICLQLISIRSSLTSSSKQSFDRLMEQQQTLAKRIQYQSFYFVILI